MVRWVSWYTALFEAAIVNRVTIRRIEVVGSFALGIGEVRYTEKIKAVQVIIEPHEMEQIIEELKASPDGINKVVPDDKIFWGRSYGW
jgi:hypothetical protein